MTNLTTKSIHELRTIAQAFGVPDIFEKDENQLRQAISIKQTDMIPDPPVIPSAPPYDPKFLPQDPQDLTEIKRMLLPFTARGLHVDYDVDSWFMTFGKKSDSGSLAIPLGTIMLCAMKVMA